MRSSRGGSTRPVSASSRKRGSLDAISRLLERGDVIVFPFDQHAAPPDGIDVEFFGHPAWTFKSLAIIALATGAPVLPASAGASRTGGTCCASRSRCTPSTPTTNEAIRRTTREYNAAIERLVLRHPEQWYWVHRRWKASQGKSRKRRLR